MYRAQWQSPPMPGFRGFGISASTFPAYTFGLSMAGMSRRVDHSWQKSIHLFGAAASRGGIGTNTSTTPFPLRNGCAAPTLTVRSRTSWLPFSRLQSAKQPALRAGYWELSEGRYTIPLFLGECGAESYAGAVSLLFSVDTHGLNCTFTGHRRFKPFSPHRRNNGLRQSRQDRP